MLNVSANCKLRMSSNCSFVCFAPSDDFVDGGGDVSVCLLHNVGGTESRALMANSKQNNLAAVLAVLTLLLPSLQQKVVERLPSLFELELLESAVAEMVAVAKALTAAVVV